MANTGRQYGMTNDKVQERNTHIVELACEGLTPKTILEHINRIGLEKEWSPLQSVRSVQLVIQQELSEQKPVPSHKLREFQEGMFYSGIAHLQLLREKMALYKMRKEKWQPFEYFKFIDAENKLIQRIINLLEKKQQWDEQWSPEKPVPPPVTPLAKDLQPVIKELERQLEMACA